MNNFWKGLFIGVGIGLLVAPMKGEEMRRRIAERAQEMRGYLPENEQIQMYTHRVSDQLSHTTDSLKGYAQQAASSMKSTAGTLGDKAQSAASSIRRGGRQVSEETQDMVDSDRNNMSGD
ncbi:MAG: YtxH domain-containing protein [Ktedonobacteraceae bacterium]|jgi:gas vesicle protein|nr:YtxH domain-containing protein [Ktedonobacteraceae bacterium]MBO0792863.1 YtxH domain-containing protein [Ktedonobacteraceae bacterium]